MNAAVPTIPAGMTLRSQTFHSEAMADSPNSLDAVSRHAVNIGNLQDQAGTNSLDYSDSPNLADFRICAGAAV